MAALKHCNSPIWGTSYMRPAKPGFRFFIILTAMSRPAAAKVAIMGSASEAIDCEEELACCACAGTGGQ